MDYYFPGEWISFISELFSKHQSSQIEKWLIEDGVCGYLYILYRVSWDVWKVSDFYTICDNKGAIITVVLSSDGFIIGIFSDEPWKFYGGYYDYDSSACGYLCILYRVSRDVWKVSDFYSICDNKGAIISMVHQKIYQL